MPRKARRRPKIADRSGLAKMAAMIAVLAIAGAPAFAMDWPLSPPGSRLLSGPSRRAAS